MQSQLLQLGNGAHALATQMLGSADDAADAVQDALFVALQKPTAYDAERGSLRAWFMRVVRNRCIDQIRRRRPTGGDIDALADTTAGPEQLLELEQRDQALSEALSRLNKEQREILVLRDYADLSYDEIAGVLDVAAGTVMSRLHRARLALRKEIERHGH